MKIRVFTPKASFGSNTYLCSEGEEAFVVDASVPYGELPKEERTSIRFLLLTHAHFDHIGALESYADAGIPILLSSEDAPMLNQPRLNASAYFGSPIARDVPYQTLNAGDGRPVFGKTLKVIATPGHTPGSLCYELDGVLFTGDTLFAGGDFGRCDLPLGNGQALVASLKSLSSLSPETVIYPGHGPSDSLGNSLARLPF